MTETTEALPTSSEYAEQLVAAGMQPTAVSDSDFKAMLQQLNTLQSQVNQLNAERGVPLDRVDGYRQQLEAHFAARKASRPDDTDYTAPETALAKLPTNPDDITAAHTEALHFTMAQWLKQHPGKEFDYLETLAGELHQTVLEREGKNGVMHKRVAELEDQLSKLRSEPTVPAAQFAALEAKVSALLAQTATTNG